MQFIYLTTLSTVETAKIGTSGLYLATNLAMFPVSVITTIPVIPSLSNTAEQADEAIASASHTL